MTPTSVVTADALAAARAFTPRPSGQAASVFVAWTTAARSRRARSCRPSAISSAQTRAVLGRHRRYPGGGRQLRWTRSSKTTVFLT